MTIDFISFTFKLVDILSSCADALWGFLTTPIEFRALVIPIITLLGLPNNSFNLAYTLTPIELLGGGIIAFLTLSLIKKLVPLL